MAIYSNISVDQGSDFYSSIDLETLDQQPLNIVNYTARAQIRKTYASANYVDFNASVVDETTGKISISLSSDQTSAMKAGRYVYDVEIVSSAGEVTRVLEGQVEITPSATRVSS